MKYHYKNTIDKNLKLRYEGNSILLWRENLCRHDIHILYHKNTPHPNKPKKNSAAVLSVQNLIWEGSVGQHVLSTEK